MRVITHNKISLKYYDQTTLNKRRLLMIINFDKIEEKSIEGFKGGKGTLLTRMADDGNVKIMRNVLKPGSSIGTHTHTADLYLRRRKGRNS